MEKMKRKTRKREIKRDDGGNKDRDKKGMWREC